MVKVIEKLLLVLGPEKGLGSESTFEVIRQFINCEGRAKLFFLIQGEALMIRIKN